MLSPHALRVLDNHNVYERIKDKALQSNMLTYKNGNDQTVDQYCFGSEKMFGHHTIRTMAKELL